MNPYIFPGIQESFQKEFRQAITPKVLITKVFRHYEKRGYITDILKRFERKEMTYKELINSKRRFRELNDLKALLSHLLRKHCSCSVSECGRLLGPVDHSTAIHRLKNAEDFLQIDEQFKKRYRESEEAIFNKHV